MKEIKRKSVRFGVFSVISCLLVGHVFAQENKVETTTTDSELTKKRPANMTAGRNPQSSYLDIFHSKIYVETNISMFRKTLMILKVITSNFGTPEHKNSIPKLQTEFKQMLTSYYEGKYVKSASEMRDLLAQTNVLYDEISTIYQKRVSDIIKQCSEKVVELELGSSIEPGAEADSNFEVIEKVRNRLNIAFAKYNEGENLQVDHRYDLAINQFRISKMYAISILEYLTKNKEEKDKVQSEYSTDLKDINNIINDNIAIKN